jgi:two-component SAPR family response regulator
MSIKTSIEAIYNSLREVAFRSKLLLLHPKSRYSNILVAKLTQDEAVHCFYYALQPADKGLKSLIENLGDELSQQTTNLNFGKDFRNLLAKAGDSSENLDQLANQVVQILDNLSPKPYLLILDDFDLADKASEVQPFIELIAGILPAHAHMIIRSRHLPRLSWLELMAKKQANIFFDGQILDENFRDPDNKREGKIDLEAFALDNARVLYKGKPVDNWEGHLPKLLFFFVLNRGQVTRTEICQAFWPELPIDQAVNVFHVTKRRLHKALGLDILIHSDDHYQISPDVNVYYDVIAFVEGAAKARNSRNNTHELWQKALSLYHSPFLKNYNEPWVQASRDAFDTVFAEATEVVS